MPLAPHHFARPPGAHSTVEHPQRDGYAVDMVVFLRSRRRLRCLCAWALFAWLMLAVAPFVAWPQRVSQQAPTPHTHASMAMDDAGCCNHHAGQPDRSATPTCHCASLPCSGMLPCSADGLAALPLIRASYAPPRPIAAPLSGFAPPLRPPLA